MIGLSTGLMSGLLLDRGLMQVMQGGIIRLYDTVRPVSPNDPSGSPVIGTITQNGALWAPGGGPGGLLLDMVYPNFLQKSGRWILIGKAPGTATWWRWCGPLPDDQLYSVLWPRIDGDCASDLVLPDDSYTLAAGQMIEIEAFVLGFSDTFAGD